ncbi:hypothetical protein KQ878_03435 [Mycoplasma zalophidermidis]|uniref:Uncharacterized protein n=1 Tax=Mycoplasma zalophidermidis TaxID=398174 RepID=A0ABS6DTH3_9MOLU|nr:hypothetical protein [Mycoplasma zalophidermidis]MBU4693920.1 hypothetical protein [Mycoplasma zalophidermidis]
MMNDNEKNLIIDYLKEYISNIKSKITKNRKLFNINSFSQLDKTGLEFGKLERRLLLYETLENEKIYIQYPGKETKFTGDKARPWDFRPKLLNLNGEAMDDLAFPEIWNDLENLLRNKSHGILAQIAALFYRTALLYDSILVHEKVKVETIDVINNSIKNVAYIDFDWYKVNIDNKIWETLNNSIGHIRGFSFEAYLLYNDLLAQNEDCKYFYRAESVKNEPWKENNGRLNTFKTHISIIGYLNKKIKFYELMQKFQRGNGLAVPTQNEIELITEGIIKKKGD